MNTVTVYVTGSGPEYDQTGATVIPGEADATPKRRAVLKDLWLLDYLCVNADVLYHDLDCAVSPELTAWLDGKEVAAGYTGNVADSFLVYSNNVNLWLQIREDYIRFNYASHGPIYGFLSKIMRRKGIPEIPRELYSHSGYIINTLKGGVNV